MKRMLAGLLAAAALGVAGLATAQTTRLSIGTGGTGGVYYPCLLYTSPSPRD